MARMDFKQAKMLDEIQPSGIRKMFARAQGLEGVISLGIGAPDVQPPEGLIEAVKNNLSNPRAHSYTLNSGIIPLREKIVNQYSDVYNLDFSTNGVVVGAGGTQLMFGAFFAYSNPGENMIVPDPGFVYYPTIPAMAGNVVKSVPMTDKFQLDVDKINESVNDRTRMIIINSPGNPSGTIQTDEVLKGIADIAIDNNIVVFSDEVYEFMAFDGIKHTPMAKFAPEHTLTLNSFSKTYCVPGWRLGYAVGSDDIIKPLAKIHPYMVANPPSLWQYAVADFMGSDGEMEFRKTLRDTMESRRNVTVREFGKIPGITIPDIHGSFYAFPRIDSEKYSSDNPGEEFVEEAFDKAKVVMVPASEFGSAWNNHFRISFGSANEEKLKESAQRIIENVN